MPSALLKSSLPQPPSASASAEDLPRQKPHMPKKGEAEPLALHLARSADALTLSVSSPSKPVFPSRPGPQAISPCPTGLLKTPAASSGDRPGAGPTSLAQRATPPTPEPSAASGSKTPESSQVFTQEPLPEANGVSPPCGSRTSCRAAAPSQVSPGGLKPATSGKRVAPHKVWINPNIKKPEPANMPSPFSGHKPKPHRVVLVIFAGRNATLASAAKEIGVPCFQPFGACTDPSLDMLNDGVFQSLLALCWSGKVDLLCLAPPSGPHDVCQAGPERLERPPGPKKRQSQQVATDRQVRLRAHQLATAVATVGGCFILEHPPTSPVWLEPSAQQLLRAFNATFAWVDACEYGLPVKQAWAFASNDARVARVAARCTHHTTHPRFLGKRARDGSLSPAGLAQYPLPLAKAMINAICDAWPRQQGDFLPLPLSELEALPPLPSGGPRAPVCDGAGWVSSADHTLPAKEGPLAKYAERMTAYLLEHDLPKQIAASIASGSPDHPIPTQHHQGLLQACLQNEYSDDLAQTQAGQPFRLNLMQFLAKALGDPDIALLDLLREGVPTGVFQALPSSHQWPQVPEAHPLHLPLEACLGNWKPEENLPSHRASSTRKLLMVG